MATISTEQSPKDIVSPGTGQRFEIKLVWDLDPATLLPVNVRQEVTAL